MKELVTFSHDFESVGSKGNTWYFKIRDQYCGEGPFPVLAPCMGECYPTGTVIPVKMWKIVPDECSDEFYMVPIDIALSGDKIIPEGRKNMRKWYEDKYWFLPVGDMKAINKSLYGIDIHGRLEHNGEEVWNRIQAVSPDVVPPRFNASCDYFSLEKTDLKDDNNVVYYIKKK